MIIYIVSGILIFLNGLNSIIGSDDAATKYSIKEQSSDTCFYLFWKSDCDYCKSALKQLSGLLQQKKADVCFTTVSFDTDSVTWASTIKTYGLLPFQNQCDFKGFQSNELAKRWGVTKTPALIQVVNNQIQLAEGNAAFAALVRKVRR